MKINAFATLVQQGGSGRVVASDQGDNFQTISQKLGGKTAVVKDFFARFSGPGAQVQNQENTNTRFKLIAALKEAYTGRIPEKTLHSMTKKLADQPTKPLSTSDIRKIMDNAQTTANQTISIQMPGNGGTLLFSTKSLPPSVVANTQNLKATIEGKLVRGHQLMNAVLGGNPPNPGPAQYKKDVNDIAWYMHLRAEAKNGGQFREGAVTTVDGHNRLRDYFDACPDSYRRESSHIGAFARVEGGGHRGIDFPRGGDIDSILPHGLETILYGAMNDTDNTPLPESMMFFKLESHGCRLWKLSGRHAEGNITDRRLQSHDLRHQLGHIFSFIATAKARATGIQSADSRKERIPKEVSEAYQSVIDNAPKGLKDILKRNDPFGTGGGIRVMCQNIQTARQLQHDNLAEQGFDEIDLNNDQAPNRPVYDPSLHDGTDLSGQTAFEQLVSNRYGETDETYSLRIGNEIILTAQDR